MTVQIRIVLLRFSTLLLFLASSALLSPVRFHSERVIVRCGSIIWIRYRTSLAYEGKSAKRRYFNAKHLKIFAILTVCIENGECI